MAPYFSDTSRFVSAMLFRTRNHSTSQPEKTPAGYIVIEHGAALSDSSTVHVKEFAVDSKAWDEDGGLHLFRVMLQLCMEHGMVMKVNVKRIPLLLFASITNYI